MKKAKKKLINTGFKVFAQTGVHNLMKPVTGGVGHILMLHRVNNDKRPEFDPNGFLTVQPDFLNAVIPHIRKRGIEIVSLDEASRRITNGGSQKPFCVITLDDGYLDNFEIAKPIFEAHRAPYTIYVATGLIDKTATPWWILLETIIRRRKRLVLQSPEHGELVYECETLDQKCAAYLTSVDYLRSIEEPVQRQIVLSAAEEADIDLALVQSNLAMSWDQLRVLAQDPLADIGGHTVHHFALSKLGRRHAEWEVLAGLDRLEEMTGHRPRHFAFPYGDKQAADYRDFRIVADLGLETAVTTRPGLVYAEHASRMTSLPRISLNGNYQTLWHLDILLSGAPFFVYNGMRRVVPSMPLGAEPAAAV